MSSRVTLAQWQMLAAVVDHGSFARAAEAVHKSPSTLNHAVHRLEALLGVPLLEPVGRNVRLTEAGEMLLRRARQLIESASALEDVAQALSQGMESEISLAVDQLFPSDLLARALEGFSAAYPQVRIQLHETTLTGGSELWDAGQVDLLVSALPQEGQLGSLLVRETFVAVAAPRHPLHALGRPLDLRDLEQHRQLVVRDSSRSTGMDAGWLKAEERWTVSHLATSVDLAERGLGFAWLPRSRISQALTQGALVPLPLLNGGEREIDIHLYLPDADSAGPGVRAMVEQLHHSVQGG
ncbi:LysR family transcriptional regulator [Cobetia marina]|uniref:LysR family transcriptional regulator n=1 Tax=Halomonadaceae TaxID=28256 RepID=UPI000864A512|nr:MULTISPECIES: LysR family transcriptional regulator [Cobetia]AOM02306.1 LysR family transcriptional regulator [Cobetia marina]MDA5563088.1 LysR family transcriptional regulator [Cobetia sp. MMG027]MDH2373231.1 LysR family transcriptional regulator [Cobetia sp. 3AK]MDI6003309.1 LysR family transcriptional regulator [Cobetia pacifica]MDN2655752.1 LysR family transcriptional regulator [Cobetia sp. 14N.309.X.WAT.E.A4]